MIPWFALGTASLGMQYGVSGAACPDAETAGRVLRAAFGLGVRLVDTAPAYGDAEVLVGRALRQGRPEGLRVGTKLSRLAPGLDDRTLDAAVRSAVDASRRRLGVEVIDDLLIHAAVDLREYGGRLVAVLERCGRDGAVDRLGVSVYDPDEALLALQYASLTVVQAPFSVFDRRIADSGVAERLRHAGRRLHARSVLLQGLLALPPAEAGRAVPHAEPWVATLHDACEAHGVDPIAAAVRFAREASGADLLILGADTEAQLRGLVEAGERPLPPALTGALRERCAGVPDAVRDPRAWPRAA